MANEPRTENRSAPERWTLDGSDTWLSGEDGDPPLWWVRARGPRIEGVIEVVPASHLERAVQALRDIGELPYDGLGFETVRSMVRRALT